MGMLSWVLVGGLVGIIVIGKTKARGLIMLGHLVVSVLGALLGGVNVAYLYQLPGALDGFHLIGVLAAFIGALLANVLLRLLIPRKNPAI